VEEAKLGMSQHGEAPWTNWKKTKLSLNQKSAALQLSVTLPVANLKFTRQIELRKNEPVVYFQETVRNLKKSDHFFHWTQHVTLAPPFLSSDDAQTMLPGTKAMTYPHGYDEGKALLTSGKEFLWPNAPLLKGGKVHLTRPFLQKGLGFMVGILLNQKRDIGFVPP
jgi:hypothetical protein